MEKILNLGGISNYLIINILKSRIIYSNLPKYTINTNNQIIEAEYFLQFIGTNKEDEKEKYLMFDI